jgi:hypothetical protein
MTEHEQHSPFFKKGEMKRAEVRLRSEPFIVIDHWIDYLGPEVYSWWKKFLTWVDRSESAKYDFHVPYTLESVYTKWLKTSKANFYKKIKVLWECGLIDIVEFDKSERKTTKPRNIIVYYYPFNKREYEYEPLKKMRDWKTEYESESKVHGYRGALKAREIRGLQMETGENDENSPVDNTPKSGDNPVDNSPVDNVDNVDDEGLQMETVEGLQMETVRVSKQRPINYLNKYNHLLNNFNNNSLNNSLSPSIINLTKEILANLNFSAGEREQIIELIIQRNITGFTKHDLIKQARYMINKPEIRMRALYFVNGLQANIGRNYPTPKKTETTPTREIPVFYNWLEQ